MKKHIYFNIFLILISSLLIMITSCSKEDEANLKLKIGDYYAGGIIFFIDETEEHGLVCSIYNHGNAEWGCSGICTGAFGEKIGLGVQNTFKIDSLCTENGIAADICINLIENGYSDWFLPSINELDSIYKYKSIIDSSAVAKGGDTFSLTYWSSTESDYFDFIVDVGLCRYWAHVNNYNIAGYEGTDKTKKFGVRPIRAF